MIEAGKRVQLIGDRYGANASLQVPSDLGDIGTVESQSTHGFWWIRMSPTKTIHAFEDELHVLS